MVALSFTPRRTRSKPSACRKSCLSGIRPLAPRSWQPEVWSVVQRLSSPPLPAWLLILEDGNPVGLVYVAPADRGVRKRVVRHEFGKLQKDEICCAAMRAALALLEELLAA